MSSLTIPQAAALLRQLDQVLILTHVRPDGDTVGCAAAVCQSLRDMGKTAYILENPGMTRSTAPYLLPYAPPAGFVPAGVVSVDIATTDLLPKNALAYAGQVDLAIDHHPSFQMFGKANLLRAEAAACGELVYDLLLALNGITVQTAEALYVAVSTDTGCFQYTNTTARTHAVAAALLETGVDCREINRIFFRTKSRKRLALEGDMLANMEFFDNERVAFLTVPLALMKRVEADESDAEDLSSLGSQIEGVDCAVTFRELQENVWKLSVRTGPRVNATAVCALLGGGGHAAAAGCTLEAPLTEVRRRILDAIAQIAPDFAGR